MRRVALTSVLLLAACSAPAASTTAPARTAQPTSAVSTTPVPSRSTSPSGSASPTLPSGLRECPLASLPAQAQDTARLIAAGGPYPYPRNDGVTYFNRSKALPQRPKGVYREFTVTTPGATTRGTRRIVTDGNPAGGAPTTTPSAWYYTGDHYNTFCRVTGTP